MIESSDEARKKAALVNREQRYDFDTLPGKQTTISYYIHYIQYIIIVVNRPEISLVVARRMIAANVDGKIARQIRAAEEEEKLIKVMTHYHSL